MSNFDFFTQTDICSSIIRAEDLLNTGIFEETNRGNPLFRSAFIELLILVNDLMHKCKGINHKICFSEDITPFTHPTSARKNFSDVFDAIKHCRDAMCHIDADQHMLTAEGVKATFNTCYGKGTILQVNSTRLESKYDDDIAFQIGPQVLYMNRHIQRAFTDCKAILTPLLAPMHQLRLSMR